MPSERRYTRDDPAVNPQLERLAHVADRFVVAAAQAERSWPVLARIPEIATATATSRPTRARTIAATGPTLAAPVAYRADPPHAAVVRPAWKKPNDSAVPRQSLQQAKSITSGDIIRSLPMGVRVAVQTWDAVQPYKPLLRMIAMFALMAAGGMSMMVMMGGGLKKSDAPVDASTAAVPAATSTDRATSPDTTTTSGDPTAVGPGRPIGGAMAIAKPSTSVDASPYPTTSYPTFALPPASDGTLPQVQTNESAASVARFQGTVEAVQAR